MICPKCDTKNLKPTGSRVKDDYTFDHYRCSGCGYVFINRKKNHPYSEEGDTQLKEE